METKSNAHLDILEQFGLSPDDPDLLYVGDDHFIQIMYEDETETEASALLILHPSQKDENTACQGFIEVGPGEWEIVSRDPFTLHPSFICPECRDHGIVRDGEWQMAYSTQVVQYMPDWIAVRLAKMCNAREEAWHIYTRPIPEHGNASMKELFEGGFEDEVAQELDKIEK